MCVTKGRRGRYKGGGREKWGQRWCVYQTSLIACRGQKRKIESMRKRVNMKANATATPEWRNLKLWPVILYHRAHFEYLFEFAWVVLCVYIRLFTFCINRIICECALCSFPRCDSWYSGSFVIIFNGKENHSNYRQWKPSLLIEVSVGREGISFNRR